MEPQHRFYAEQRTGLMCVQVYKLPPGGEVLGWSEKTAIEIFAVGEHVLGIQGHPEFGRDVAEDIFTGRLALGILTVCSLPLAYMHFVQCSFFAAVHVGRFFPLLSMSSPV